MLQEPICVNLWHQGSVLTGPSHSEWRLKPQIPNSPKLQPWQLSATKAPAANKGWMEHVWHCRLIAMVSRWVKMLFWLLKQLLPREKVSEMVHFEVMGKAVFGRQGELTGEKTRTDKELRADGCSNKEQTCSHVNKGFNCKHLQKKKKKKCFFKNMPFSFRCCSQMTAGRTQILLQSHTSSGKARVQKKDFRQGAKLKWQRMWKLKSSSAGSSQVTRCCHRSLWELLVSLNLENSTVMPVNSLENRK